MSTSPEALSPVRAALSALIREAPLDATMLDRDGRIIEMSDVSLAAAGAGREQIVGQLVTDLFGETGHILSKVLAPDSIETPVNLQPVRIVNPSGEVQWIRTSCSPWRDESGQVGGIMCFNHNITTEQRAIIEQGRAEALLDAIVESIPSMISVQDFETREFERINRAAEAFIGKPREQVVGAGPLHLVGDEADARHWEQIRQAAAANQVAFDEEPVNDGAGRLRTLQTRRQVIEDREGVKHVLTVAEDVTEQRRSEEALQAALREAEAANEAKTVFLATMSHEIRTPLNGVLGMAQAMALDVLSDEQRTRLDIIHQSGAALLMILNDILDLSKIEAGKLELEEVDFDFPEVVASAVAGLAVIARDKGVALSIDTEATRGRYRGDPTRIRQIVSNLVSNSVKFTERGEVRVTATRSGDDIRIAVSDTGAGISPEGLGRLFEKFVQADTSTTRRFGGTGLGLAICRDLTALMGGSISADSRLGEGSTFTVLLPLPRAPDADASIEPEAEADAASTLPGPSLRVLAAEDNEVNQLVLKALLQHIGAEPHIVNDGLDAVAAWETGDWDVILMDVQMPRMDGPAATRIIRERECATGRQRTPVIALTANAMSHQVDEYLAAGMDSFVAKPIDVSRLFAAIEEALAPLQTADQAVA